MKSAHTLAIAVAVTLGGGAAAQAAPQKSDLFGTYQLEGRDTSGAYRGELVVSDGGTLKVRLSASVRYADGSQRGWQALGFYLAGQVSYSYASSPGIAGHLPGSGAVQARVRGVYKPSDDGTRLEGRFGNASFKGDEVATRAPRPRLEGRYVARADWDSFNEWHLEFKDNVLLDSHTDDLPARDWPTHVEWHGDELHLIQTTEASDALITERLVLEVEPGAAAGAPPLLRPRYRVTTYVDFTSDQAHHVGVERDVAVEQPDGQVLR